jgi:hypothetical protein
VPLFHEFTKYAVSLVLGLELIRYGKLSPNVMLLYGLCLVPGVLIVEGDFGFVRRMVSANLSGPFCLMVATLYFYKRPIDTKSIRKVFLCFLCPLAAMVGFLWVNTPDLSEVDFGVTSNFETSVWGPNQVSSILGLGILIIGLSFFLKVPLFSPITSIAFLVMLLFRGLLTFSRGGMIAPVLVLLVVFAFLSWYSLRTRISTGRIVWVAVVFVGVAIAAFVYTNQITDNALYYRYTGIRKDGRADLEDYTSGRTLILRIDWQIFKDHYLLGVGAGMAKPMRSDYGYPFAVAAHNEFTRLLAEHGLPGIVALLILMGLPVFVFFRKRTLGEKALMLAMIGFCFTFMMHSATRIAIPLVLYGFAFSTIRSREYFKRAMRDVQVKSVPLKAEEGATSTVA